MSSITETIKNTKLTKTQRRLANYILDHSSEACFMTSMDLAHELKTSEASVVRFCRALGFTGYIDFQKTLRNEFQQKLSEPFQSMNVPAEKLLASAMEGDEFYLSQYNSVTENLQTSLMSNSYETIAQAADMIVKARNRYISATRGNSGLGECFHLYLNQLLPNVGVTSIPGLSAIDKMLDISEDDVLIMFSFPRYSSVDKVTLQMATDAGAKILLFTDKPSAALAPYATLVLTAPVEINAFFNSIVAPAFLMEAVLNAVSHRLTDTEGRLRLADKYLAKLRNY